jgi:hypothetical protein
MHMETPEQFSQSVVYLQTCLSETIAQRDLAYSNLQQLLSSHEYEVLMKKSDKLCKKKK